MTLAKIKRRAVEMVEGTPPGKKPEIVFTIRGSYGNGRKRLFGKRGPIGYALAEYEDMQPCIFDAREIVAYFEKHERELIALAQKGKL
jgi:hypothetical protein